MGDALGEDDAGIALVGAVGKGGGVLVGNNANFGEGKVISLGYLGNNLVEVGVLSLYFLLGEKLDFVEIAIDKVGDGGSD